MAVGAQHAQQQRAAGAGAGVVAAVAEQPLQPLHAQFALATGDAVCCAVERDVRERLQDRW